MILQHWKVNKENGIFKKKGWNRSSFILYLSIIKKRR